ncbi:hypothetical protein Sjap_023530 [Stephania japonica]|uniref:SAGA-associated factor 11 n=1 Tax=Stephania japonica TaxID=461633 RepID=A0AAP0EJ17_9MAGN
MLNFGSILSICAQIRLHELAKMSKPGDEHAVLSSQFYGDLLDSIIVDVASECHRIARLGLDRNLEDEEEELRLSTQARARVADPSNSGEANSKYVVDIIGQTHPSVASEIFECMNCGRSIMAGRFAPHLEKCMGRINSQFRHGIRAEKLALLIWLKHQRAVSVKKIQVLYEKLLESIARVSIQEADHRVSHASSLRISDLR